MGVLAIDIETASPFQEPSPGENDTEYFEWVVTSVAYRENDQSELETDVQFRQGGWDDKYTADMLDQLLDWCDGREINRVVTYNGAWFDLKHIGTWARQFEDERTLSGRYPELISLFDVHVDLAKAAADHYSDELWEEQEVLPDWKVYQLTGIDNESVWYEDYEFNDAYFDGLGIDSKHVKGEHVGQVLGEQYVDGITHGLQHTNTHQELKRLLRDYAESDVADLLILYDRLGGEDLIDEYQYPLETIVD